VQQGGGRHAAGRRERGQQSVAGIGQLADVELALEFEPDQQEEHGHQCVVDPVFQRERPELDLPHREIRPGGGRIREDQRHDGAPDQQDPGKLLGFREADERGGQRWEHGHM
jgi:hypothetical protein